MFGWLPAGPEDRTQLPARLQAFLTVEERVVRAQRDHIASLSGPLLLLFGGLALVVSASPTAGADGASVLWMAWLVLFAWVLYRVWDWSRRWFIVTDKRIMRASGTLQTRIAQLMIALGKDITVEQNLLGEWLRFGTFRVESAKDEHPLRVTKWLAEPDLLYQAISATVQGRGAGASTDVAPVIGGDGDGGMVMVDRQRRPGSGQTEVTAVIGGDGDDGGIVIVDQDSRNPTQQLARVPGDSTARKRDRMGLAAARALERIAPAAEPAPRRRAGQNANPGIISSSRPAAHSRQRAVQDYGYSDGAASRGTLGGLGRVKGLGLFGRRR